jgi:hypothetical protein
MVTISGQFSLTPGKCNLYQRAAPLGLVMNAVRSVDYHGYRSTAKAPRWPMVCHNNLAFPSVRL